MKIYKTYNFKDKDPVIDLLRTAVKDQKMSYADVERGSGVTTTTLYNWFNGPTRCPQFASVKRVAFALGLDIVLVKREGAGRQFKVIRGGRG